MTLADRLFDYPTPPGAKARDRLAGLVRAARDEPARYLAYVSLFSAEERRRLECTGPEAHRLVEFASRLPLPLRLARRRNKAVLRDNAARVLPELPAEEGKNAFVVQFDGEYGTIVREMAGDVLSSARFHSLKLFDDRAVDSLLAAFPSPSFLVGRQIMALMMFALWYEAVAAA